MANTKYYPHVVSLNSTVYSGVRRQDMAGNTERSAVHTDGQVDPTHAALMGSSPTLTHVTYNVGAILAAVGIDGAAITNLTAFWKKGADCGTRAGATSHVKSVATSGCSVMRALRAQQGQRSVAEIEHFLKSSDGLADPWTHTFDQSLAGSFAEVSQYTLGPVWITPSGGSRTPITVSGWEIDPGVQVDTVITDGVTFPTYVGIDKRMPTGSINSPDIAHLEDIPMSGIVGEVELFLRKLAEGTTSGRVPNATAEHIKVTISDALITLDSASADTDSDGEVQIVIDGTYDGSNAVFTFDFSAAIE